MSKLRKFLEKASESAHPMICLLSASDDVIPGKQKLQPNSLLSVDCMPSRNIFVVRWEITIVKNG